MIAHHVNWLEIIVCLLLYHVDCRPSVKFIKNSVSSQHTEYRYGNKENHNTVIENSSDTQMKLNISSKTK